MPEHLSSEGETPPRHAEDTPLVAPAEPQHRAARTGGEGGKHSRRVTTPAPEGSDPTPEPEQGRHALTENDEQLRRDIPPHWG